MYGPVLVSPGDEEELADYVIRKFSVQMVSLFWIICTYVAFSEMVSEPFDLVSWVSQSLSQSLKRSARQLVGESVGQSVNQLVS